MFKVAGCLVARLPRLSAPSPPDVRALHPGHDPLGILMELSDPLPPAHADTANMGLRSGEKIEIVALAASELLHRGSGDSLYLLEHKTCDILAAERLRLMSFDNRLIIDSFQKAI